MINSRKIAPCALSILMALSATLLPCKNTSATDSASPPSCKEGYEYVEAVGKCYKKCQEGWERNPETNRCRKTRTEEGSTNSAQGSQQGSQNSSQAAQGSQQSSQGSQQGSQNSQQDSSGPSQDLSQGPSTSSQGSTGTTNNSQPAASTPPSCKEDYEYVESVGKCYKKCQEGWERNPETNRCRKATSEPDHETSSSETKATKNSADATSKSNSTSSPKSCKEGYEYVEAAGKCYKKCAENQVRNPETNRCKKAQTDTDSTSKKSSNKTNDGADYGIEVPNTGDKKSFIATGSIIALVAAGLIFIGFQYRAEIWAFLKKHFKKH